MMLFDIEGSFVNQSTLLLYSFVLMRDKHELLHSM